MWRALLPVRVLKQRGGVSEKAGDRPINPRFVFKTQTKPVCR